MIRRVYICENCEYAFEKQQELHDESRCKKCPQCKKYTLYQDLTGQHTFVKQEPKTLGHLAGRNRDSMGRYELEAREKATKIAQDKPKLETLKSQGLAPAKAETLDDVPGPFYNPDRNNLSEINKLTPKQKLNYIKTGNPSE